MGSRTQVYFDGDDEQSCIYCHNDSHESDMIPWLRAAFRKAVKLKNKKPYGCAMPFERGTKMSCVFVSIHPERAYIENDATMHEDLDNIYIVRSVGDYWTVCQHNTGDVHTDVYATPTNTATLCGMWTIGDKKLTVGKYF